MAELFSDAIVFESALVRVGAFRCASDYPRFQNTGPVRQDCFVFPRTAVQIEHEHEAPFAANPNVVTFYNRAQQYVRHKVSEQGDRCDWFGIDRDLAREIVSGAGLKVDEMPFLRTRAGCDARTYLLQRKLFQGIVSGAIIDTIRIEETVIDILRRVLGVATRPNAKALSTVRDVECFLASRFEEPLTLADIATRAGTSVFHLCRTFRDCTGLAVHQYLHQLRIRHGLEAVCESEYPLSRIAVDLGFAHHSHFTSAFRRNFGVTPSALRPSYARSRC